MKIMTNNGGNRSVPTQYLEQQGKVTLAISHNGFEFDYQQNKWVLNRNVTIDLNFLTQFNVALAEDVRETLVYFAENSSAHHTSNLSKRLKLYLELSRGNDFSELNFLAVKGALPKKDEYKPLGLTLSTNMLRGHSPQNATPPSHCLSPQGDVPNKSLH